MELKWTRTALSRLEKIAEYISQDNPSRAISFITELRDKIDILANFPGVGVAGRVNGIRELIIYENYRVIYRVLGDELQILRIQHSRMKNYENLVEGYLFQ